MSSVSERVRGAIASLCDLSDIDATANLEDLGLDSADWVELHIGLLEEFDIDIPDEAAVEFRSVADIIRYVQATLSETES